MVKFEESVRKKLQILPATGLCLFLSACQMAERLSNVGEPPELSQIQDPTLVADYEPVTMPMPMTKRQTTRINSLWQSGARAFFKDQRACQVGDVLTVKIDLFEKIELDKDFQANRKTLDASNITNLFGYEEYLGNIFPSTVDKNKLTTVNSVANINSMGNVKKREDTLKVELAATIIQILPNGNMVIEGRQDIRMSGELKTVDLKGIIRREDILSDNSITYDKVAEARISSVGKGEMSDLARVPWGQEVLDKVLPF